MFKIFKIMAITIINMIDKCFQTAGELLYNYSFDCGVKGWHFDPNYTAVITDNGNGSIHLRTTSNYGSVVPDNQNYPHDTYVLTIDVANVVGGGKMSIRNTANTWFNLETFNADGTYSVEYTGDIKDIHCGADNDTSFQCDFLKYSLMKKTDYCRPQGDELVSNWTFYCNGMDWITFNADANFDNNQVTVIRTGLSGSVRQSIRLIAGKSYRLETNVLSTSSSTFISVTDPAGATTYPVDYLDVGVHSVEYTPTQTGDYIVGVGSNTPNGSSAKFDYLSVKEI